MRNPPVSSRKQPQHVARPAALQAWLVLRASLVSAHAGSICRDPATPLVYPLDVVRTSLRRGIASVRIGLASRSWVLIVTGFAAAGCESDDPQPAASSETNAAAESMTEADGFFTAEEIETILDWLGPLPETPPPDPSNAYADDPLAARLGQDLFYDPRYSGNGEISCATCHEPEDGFGDSRANVSQGIELTPRASMGLLNGAYGSASENETNWQLWDGRSDSQWAQALGPPENAVTMGGTRTKIALLIADEYLDAYEAVFGPLPMLRNDDGTPMADPTLRPGVEGWDALPEQVRTNINTVYVNFGKAIAAYERLLVSRNSAFDELYRDLADGALDSDAMTDEAKEGLRVFIGDGRCLGCHSGPNFTDGQFHNIGVPQTGTNIEPMDRGRQGGIETVLASVYNCAGIWSDHPDKSACSVAGLDPATGELGAFKTPSLRSVNLTPPYMHTGNLATLDDVIRHYDSGGAVSETFDGTRDELIRPLALDESQRNGLIAFIEALEGEPLDASLVGPN